MRLFELKPLIALLCCVVPIGTGRAAPPADDPSCGMLPDEVVQSDIYAGWSACRMKKAGEKPLWHGLAKGEQQVMRFIFTHGHGMFYRMVQVVERADGTAELKVIGTHNRRHYRHKERRIGTRREVLHSDDLARIKTLATDSGTWDHAVGTWDGTGDDQEIYMHCQVLEMERVNADGYRFSSVNIGCNQPKKLMPLVNEIVRVARMKNTNNGMLFE